MRSLLLSLMLIVASLPLLADPPMTNLKIEVKTHTDKPVDRASVIVTWDEGRSVFKLGKKTITKWQLKTNQDGITKVPPLPQGFITIQVIAKGYQTFGDTFEVKEPERTIEVKLNPPQQQYSAHE